MRSIDSRAGLSLVSLATALAPLLALAGAGCGLTHATRHGDAGQNPDGLDGGCGPGSSRCNGVCVATAMSNTNCGGCGVACTAGATCMGGACICPGGGRQCGSSCVDTSVDNNNCGACGTVCGTGTRCTSGACACASGLTGCSGTCRDTQTDPANCGTCAHACPAGATCAAGACVCPGGTMACGARCVDLATDPMNCGMCGHACGSRMSCSGGACHCPPGETDCGGTCVDTTGDPANCGTCGHTCAAGQFCTSSLCDSMCRPPAATMCGVLCVNTLVSSLNCGMCGHACSGGQSCMSGVCMCPAGQMFCSGTCRAVATDPNNCGTCGTMCTGGRSCTGGACVCPAGQMFCSGVCTTTATDPNNCGTCGTMCTGGRSCTGGACVCPAGQMFCSGVCTNTATDNANCGACGTACSGGRSCAGGTCVCPAGQTFCGTACTDTTTDNANCGTCGRACGSGAACMGGTCACTAGLTMCGTACVDTMTDSSNCGACARACPAGMSCSAGVCGCPAGQDLVGTSCIAVSGSVTNARQLGPISASITATRRPELTWVNGAGADGAWIELCRDRACTPAMRISITNVAGAAFTPPADLMLDVVYWRARARMGTTSVSPAWSPVWQFTVTHRNGPSTVSWGAVPDFNGDGFADAAVGAPGAMSGAGQVFVFSGSAAGVPTTPTAMLAGAAGERFGDAVASAGDLNGDGFADLVVGAPATPNGRAVVFLGSATGLVTSAPIALPGASAEHRGTAVDAAGDVNGDGYGDVIVGTAGASAYVYYGGASFDATADVTLTGGADFGSAVAGACDVNGDGYGDVVVGESNSNTARVFLGASVGLSTSAATTLMGGGDYGRAVACLGDVNRDGFTDIAVTQTTGGASQQGVYVYQGSATGIPTTEAVQVMPASGGTNFGAALAGGDTNGDGASDLVVGMPGGNGQVITYPGSSGGINATMGRASAMGASGSQLGRSVDAADFNRDGFADVLAGSPGSPQALVYAGAMAGVAMTATTTLPPPGGAAEFGNAVAACVPRAARPRSPRVADAPARRATPWCARALSPRVRAGCQSSSRATPCGARRRSTRAAPRRRS